MTRKAVTVSGWLVAAVLFCAVATHASAQVGFDPAAEALFARAEAIKVADNAGFKQLLVDLSARRDGLSETQRWHLAYLQGWQDVYQGRYEASITELRRVLDGSTDRTLRFRTRATLINPLAATHQYEPAYRELDRLLKDLPSIEDPVVRFQGIGEATQLLVAAGQADLATQYARLGVALEPQGISTCQATYLLVMAMSSARTLPPEDPAYEQGIDACVATGNLFWADAIRLIRAQTLIRQGQIRPALTILQRFQSEVARSGYGALIHDWAATWADALYRSGDLDGAYRHARQSVPDQLPVAPTPLLARAYQVLYEVAKRRGNAAEALDWHERFVEADKHTLDAASASSLAYQRVKQEVDDKLRQLQQAEDSNRILQLRQALDRKAVQASRLSIVLLLTVLASVVFWLIRLKRSQKRFMRLARHDGLTGIFNRQHFVEQAERMLAAAQRDGQHVCLLLMDLDHFKLINDAHGHAFGDLVLKRAVAVCHDHLRKSDIFGRLGGEEFGILLPGCMLASVAERAEAIRVTIAETSDDEDTRGVVISASLGVASTEHAGYDLQQLMADADNALYRAKRGGRNRVVLDDVPQGEAASL
ncbi:GGDEF domain-containing protein [Dyella sp. KULCS107]|uniref:GGDEF domain-containing protein n=1 Tax=Dyella sp. KULCS107 TaxID=3422216 RepID=UPI003D6EF3A1